jgi:hypothetical protein
MASITRSNVKGAPKRPNAILSCLKLPNRFMNPILSLSSSLIGMFQYAFSISNMVKYLLPAISERLLLISGMGYTGVIVTEFKP